MVVRSAGKPRKPQGADRGCRAVIDFTAGLALGMFVGVVACLIVGAIWGDR